MKFCTFLIGLLLIGEIAFAEQQVRKVPFLPYAGIMTRYPTQIITSAGGQRIITQSSVTARPAKKSYESIFFEEGSSKIREDQFEKVRHLAQRLRNEGSRFYSVVSFTTPQIDSVLANARIKTMIAALEDFGIKGEPTTSIEHKKNPVLNPNRVEVYMQSLGLGPTIKR